MDNITFTFGIYKILALEIETSGPLQAIKKARVLIPVLGLKEARDLIMSPMFDTARQNYHNQRQQETERLEKSMEAAEFYSKHPSAKDPFPCHHTRWFVAESTPICRK